MRDPRAGTPVVNPVAIGPFLFSMGVLALLGGVLAAHWTARFLARGGRADASTLSWWLLGLAVLAARVGYVVRQWPAYAAHPGDMLNVRDGGFDPLVGLLVLVIASVAIAWVRPRWRRPLLGTVAVGVAAWALVLFGGTQLRAAAHPPLPALEVHDLDGRRIATATWRGRPLVLNFWATWCGPCRREMPVLVQAQHDHPGVRFVFADQAESATKIRSFLAARGLKPENVLIDDGALAGYYRVRGYPTTLFIGADGRLRDIHVGELSHATLRASLQRIDANASPRRHPAHAGER
jgi:thiol-disulfide isomerase/thioredoxin